MYGVGANPEYVKRRKAKRLKLEAKRAKEAKEDEMMEGGSFEVEL